MKHKERWALARAVYARYLKEYAERDLDIMLKPLAEVVPWTKLKPVIRQLWVADCQVVEMGGESSNPEEWVRNRLPVWVKDYFAEIDRWNQAHRRPILEKLAPGEPDPRD